MHPELIFRGAFFVMTCNDIIKYLEQWAPPGIAWQKDNVGLQVGSLKNKIKNIMLALELTDNVVADAIKKDCSLIITHHPLLFYPLKKIDTGNDQNSKLIKTLIQKDITLYSAHTNLDFTRDGVSFRLARQLKLKNIRFLKNLKSNQVKLVVFVPEQSVEKVASAIFNSGGGKIGDYEYCSFRLNGQGSFKGSDSTNPAVGQKGIYEKVEEVRFEVLVDSWNLGKVLKAMISAHPYEEPAFDIYPLENENVNYGIGAIGELETSLTETKFLNHVVDCLNVSHLRHTKVKNQKIKTVAVCGGSGSELLNEAIAAGANAFVTADVKYHTFQDAAGKLMLVDAGHYETEIFSLDEIKKRLKSFTGKEQIKVFKYGGSTNPVNYFNK